MRTFIYIFIISFFLKPLNLKAQELIINSSFESAVITTEHNKTDDLAWAIITNWQDSSWTNYSSENAVIYRNKKLVTTVNKLLK